MFRFLIAGKVNLLCDLDGDIPIVGNDSANAASAASGVGHRTAPVWRIRDQRFGCQKRSGNIPR